MPGRPPRGGGPLVSKTQRKDRSAGTGSQARPSVRGENRLGLGVPGESKLCAPPPPSSLW